MENGETESEQKTLEGSFRTAAHLRAWIAEQQIDAQMLEEIGDTPTVPAAAKALGVSPEQIVKTLLFLVSTPSPNQTSAEGRALPQPVVVISNGISRVDKRSIAKRFNVGRKQVSLASPAQVLAETGFPAGGVPPFGHLNKNPVILDQSIVASGMESIVYGGGGDDKTMLALSVGELLRITQPIQIMELS